MRKTALDMVDELARMDERVVFVGSDLGPEVLRGLKERTPERFFMEGVSEQALVSMCAGMALEGAIPYFNTIATFITRRCFEQNVLDLGLHNTNVRLIANGGGLVYAPLGPTHLAIDDLAIMRTIPNMAVVAPADALEMRRFMLATLDHEGPIYIRLGKGGEAIRSRDDGPFRIGKAVPMREGRDALLVSTGITLGTALDAAAKLEERGHDAGVLHMPSVKPFDQPALLERAVRVRAVVTLEEHLLTGGLGSAVAEALLDEPPARMPRLRRIGLPDAFTDAYGSQESLLERYGITARAAVRAVVELLGTEKV